MTLTQKRTPIIHNYQLNGHSIERVNEIRDLGVILDKKLNFHSHIEYAINKSKAALQFVKRQSYRFRYLQNSIFSAGQVEHRICMLYLVTASKKHKN